MTITHHDTEIRADEHVPAIHIERVFDATPAQLFRAHTDPEIVPRWLGPRDAEMELGVWDCRNGGEFRYVHRVAEVLLPHGPVLDEPVLGLGNKGALGVGAAGQIKELHAHDGHQRHEGIGKGAALARRPGSCRYAHGGRPGWRRFLTGFHLRQPVLRIE